MFIEDSKTLRKGPNWQKDSPTDTMSGGLVSPKGSQMAMYEFNRTENRLIEQDDNLLRFDN